MKPTRKEISEKLIEMVREYTKKGEKKLPSEREMAQDFGISRNMLREALVSVVEKGILEIREKQGIFIKRNPLKALDVKLDSLTIWPEEYIRHVMEVRFVIEVPAAMMAAANRTEKEIEKIALCIKNLSEVQFPDSDGEASLWDANFHSSIVDASHNPLLGRMYENFSAFMKNFIEFRRKRLFAVNLNPEMILSEHKMILNDIINQDTDNAAKHMQSHLSKTLRNYGADVAVRTEDQTRNFQNKDEKIQEKHIDGHPQRRP